MKKSVQLHPTNEMSRTVESGVIFDKVKFVEFKPFN